MDQAVQRLRSNPTDASKREVVSSKLLQEKQKLLLEVLESSPDQDDKKVAEVVRRLLKTVE
jgi:hypothetical protein